MDVNEQLPKPYIFLICLLQGIALTYLYKSVEWQFWPGNKPYWLIPIATFTVSFPLMTLLITTKDSASAFIKLLLPFSLLLTALGAYIGWQQEPTEYIDNWAMVGVFSFTALIASFKALMYVQHYVEHTDISYSSLFKLSWRNFIIFGESIVFALIFWGILHLGAALFAVVGIEVFEELLTKDWFVIPVINLALGFGIFIFRNIIYTADNIATILQTLIKYLLPALTVVSIGFIFTLPFSGLDKLWQTGHGTSLVMWILLLTLFFVNTVYKDEAHKQPYSLILHRIVYLGIMLLPTYSAIAGYGLWLRIEQYGLTVGRCWALLIWFLLTCFAVSYLIAIIKKRDEWIVLSGKVNVAMGLVLLTLMLLVNSPIMNFQTLSAAHQIARLNNGTLSPNDFDYRYFKHDLGRQGYLSLQNLKIELQETNPEKMEMINRLYVEKEYSGDAIVSLSDFEKRVTYWPDKNQFDESLLEHIFNQETLHNNTGYQDTNYYFLAIDLNEDQLPEFVVIEEKNYLTHAQMMEFSDNKWHKTFMNVVNPNDNHYINDLIINGQIQTTRPQWQNLKIGNLVISVQ